MKKKKITVVLLICLACLTLCGANWFSTTKVTVDTESNYVYDQCTADQILSAFSFNGKAAREKYQGFPVLLTGKVAKVESKGKYIEVTGTIITQHSIEATCDKSLRTAALQYKTGDSIALYGRIVVNIFNNDIYLTVDKITDIPAFVTSDDMYYLLDGTSFDKKNAIRETLNNGGVEYYIPSAWTSSKIRHSVTEEKLGTMEGYQYVLNKLNPSDPVAESLFVCYFDNETHLAFESDFGETKLIEKAIIENILGKVGIFPTKKVTTYYDAEYNYYDGVFKNALETGEGYRTEFIFQADGEDGIVVILYVYREPKHVKDVLFLTRFLEIN